MSRQKQTLVIACGIAMGVFAATSTAQVAPPPTEPAKEKPTYTPEPKPQPQPATRPNQQPQPQEGMQARRRDNTSGTTDLPTNIPYPKLAKEGPDGRILRLRQLPDILAMRSNPTIGPKTVEAIMPVVYLRRYKSETAVIDNLDLYWALSDGMIENLNMNDINELARAADMIKPFVPEVTLSQDLQNRGILTRVQGGMNKHIVQEYKKAITDEVQVLDGEKGLEEVMRFVLDDSLHEARLAYEGLLVELINKVEELVEKSGVDSSAAKVLATMQQQVSENPEEQFMQIRAFDDAFRALDYNDAMQILITMRSAREFENISPTMATINVMHDRKKIMSDDHQFGVRVTDERTGEVQFNSAQQRRERQRQQEQGDQPTNEQGDD